MYYSNCRLNYVNEETPPPPTSCNDLYMRSVCPSLDTSPEVGDWSRLSWYLCSAKSSKCCWCKCRSFTESREKHFRRLTCGRIRCSGKIHRSGNRRLPLGSQPYFHPCHWRKSPILSSSSPKQRPRSKCSVQLVQSILKLSLVQPLLPFG